MEFNSQLGDIHETENKLEAIVFPIHTKEINNGRFQEFMKQFKKINTKYDIELVFVFNKELAPDKEINLYLKLIDGIRPFFNNVEIVYLNLPTEDDVYIDMQKWEYLKFNTAMPKHGLVSGPNLMFFKSMNICKKYNTVLLLETDCMLVDGWLDKCIRYVNNSGFFLISGALYDGLCCGLKTKDHTFFHKNGVAFYKTGSKTFQTLIEETQKFILDKVNQTSDPFVKVDSSLLLMSYDICMNEMIFSKINSNENYYFWRYVFRTVITNSLIINLACKYDILVDKQIIKNIIPSAVIIHSKKINE